MGSSVGLEFGKETAECSYLCKSFCRLVSPKKANLDFDIIGQKEAAVPLQGFRPRPARPLTSVTPGP